jgi:hypothetical protein
MSEWDHWDCAGRVNGECLSCAEIAHLRARVERLEGAGRAVVDAFDDGDADILIGVETLRAALEGE